MCISFSYIKHEGIKLYFSQPPGYGTTPHPAAHTQGQPGYPPAGGAPPQQGYPPVGAAPYPPGAPQQGYPPGGAAPQAPYPPPQQGVPSYQQPTGAPAGAAGKFMYACYRAGRNYLEKFKSSYKLCLII